ncbi:hypothetical protein O181_067013 [Austropuccinia psidii MF-1]|uniref:Uncharacterized protein n=1 Tax=Austropuccinia psidii MF-1 TaxID=1389203 RepID=A0A9Q3ESJ2_9BASI|nr:hypothetical protein [Austropuccinia psidii MF-1]
MPKASQRLPLLQMLNSLQLINAINSDSDSDIQEDIILLDMIASQRYINPCRRYPSRYMNTHESFEKFVAQIQAGKTFQNSSQNKQHNPAIQLAVALSRLGSNGNGPLWERLECCLELAMGLLCCTLKESSRY